VILKLAVGVRGWIAASVAVRLAIIVTYLGQALVMAGILAALLHGAGVAAQASPLAAVVAFVLVRVGLVWLADLAAQTTASQTKEQLRGRMFTKLAALGPGYTSGTRTGDLQTALIDGVEGLESYFGAYLPAFISAILTPAIAVSILFFRDPLLALVVALFVIAAIVLPPLWSRSLATAGNTRRAAFIAMGSEFLDSLQGLVTLKAFGASGHRRELLAERSEKLATWMINEMSVTMVKNGIFTFAVVGGIAATTALAAVRAANGEIAVGSLFVALFLAREALRPVGDLANAFHASYATRVAAEHIHRLLSAPVPAPETAPNALVAPLQASVALHNVTFAYTPGVPVLTDLSLEVEPGETVAIVGPSGSGKTTVISLLLRFLDPQTGRVLVGGRDVSELPSAQLRAMFAVVSQDTYLFSGTVRENLELARPGASAAEIDRAVRIARAHEFIAALPEGYDTIVGERGVRLSGGQRQRIAIARAVLKDAPILVLDEATANVDANTESAIQAALDQLTAGRTTIVVAHRLSTVRHADRILVLEGGALVESGRHDELVQRAGTYARLVSAQVVS
jgi:ATP-binding cassette subfamily C protein CydD